MGVFDFVKDAGAKVGIGDSKEEKAAAASESAAAEAAVKAKARNKMMRERANATADMRAKAKEAEAQAAADAKAEANERSETMEIYLKSMGLGDVDVRLKGDMAHIFGKAADQATREKIVLAVGNTSGVAQVSDHMIVDKAEAESDMYVVQKGDSLSKIAKVVYDDAMKYPVIFEANRPMLTDPDLIFPGQVLRIPAL